MGRKPNNSRASALQYARLSAAGFDPVQGQEQASGSFLDHIVRQGSPEHIRAFLLKTAVDDVSANLIAKQVVTRERLHHMLCQAVLKYKNSLGDPAWKVSKGTFARRAQEVMRYVHEANVLRSKIIHKIFHTTIISVYENWKENAGNFEKIESRLERMEEFWPCFHNVPGKGANRTSATSTEPGLSADTPARPDSQASQSRWKVRSSRSQCSAVRRPAALVDGEEAEHSSSGLGHSNSQSLGVYSEFSVDRLLGGSSLSGGGSQMLHSDGDTDAGALLPGLGGCQASSQGSSKKKLVRWWHNLPFEASSGGGRASPTGAARKGTMPSLPGSPSSTGGALASRLPSSVGSSRGFSKESGIVGLSKFVESRQSMLKSASLPSIRSNRGPPRSPPSEAHAADGSLSSSHKFRQPWQGSLPPSAGGAPMEKYLHSCKNSGLVPLPVPFVTGHSKCFRAKERGLNDADLGAIRDMLEEMALQSLGDSQPSGDPKHAAAAAATSPLQQGCARRGRQNGLGLEELNLESNPKLSQHALSELFLFLAGHEANAASAKKGRGAKDAGAKRGGDAASPGAIAKARQLICSQLKRLSLRKCPSMVQDGAMNGLLLLLAQPDHGLRNLRSLDLGSVALSVRHQLSLCQAIGSHPALRDVSLADTGLGGGVACNAEDGDDPTRQCIVELLSNAHLQKLDLSWNCFTQEVFEHLGQKLNEIGGVQQIFLSHCAAVTSVGTRISPMSYLLEHLVNNRSLKKIDIRENSLDFRGALILEDALEHNNILEEVDISQNAIGIIGLRSLMRALSRETSALIKFGFEQTGTGALMDSKTDIQIFRASRPQGRYHLDLVRPYHRSLLRMLYKTAERLKLAPDVAFEKIVANPPHSHPSKDAQGVFQVATSGTLSITFSMEHALEAAVQGLPERLNLQGVLEAHQDLLKIRPPEEKVIAMLMQWRSTQCLGQEQQALLDAFSKDFLLDYSHLAYMCQTRDKVPEVIAGLMQTLRGGPGERFASRLLVKHTGDYVKMLKKAAAFLDFNPENPTGRYHLDMSNSVDYHVADMIIIIDDWEHRVRLTQGQPDVSQLGDGSHARNVLYSDHVLPCTLTEWIPPEYDSLQLDYSSTTRPPVDAEPISDSAFEEIMTALLEFNYAQPADRLQAIRWVSDHLFLSCLQLRQLLGLFQNAADRGDCFVLLYNRLADIENQKIVRVRFDNAVEADNILQRLGYAATLPFLQPEQCHFKLKMANFDERLAASLVLKLAVKETLTNLKNSRFTHADGTEDPLPLGVPRSWEQMDRIPKEGVFEVDYFCSPEDRKFEARKELLSKVASWNVDDVFEDDVSWWTGIHQAPADVISFVFWVISHYDDVYQAFYEIDGGGPAGGDPEVTRSEFEEGVRRIKCKKFKGPNEQERLRNIFRYLDSSGEGKVSMSEWALLAQIQQEIKLSIKEFVTFCERTFGPDLGEAWKFMDEDGGGEIDVDEWQQCCDKVNYFGPTMPIFKFIDKDDGGSIEEPEFFAGLTKFQGITIREAIYGKTKS
eukprot:TRINITY_DN19443_c0_g1_i2.p1 TRINITY_DN19443_c0_g1~~TRINITY_DN19443_c0_g1_i2.p1  ORF type:complete len:1521 (-),score=320.87 TRINITY_DN19443_c0_g1_i2:83-4645(-)